MKVSAIVLSLIALPVGASDLDSTNYLGIELLEDQKNLELLQALLGRLDAGYNDYCVSDGINQIVFKISNDQKHSMVIVDHLKFTVSSGGDCHIVEFLPLFGSLSLGLQQLEVEERFLHTGFNLSSHTSSSITFTKETYHEETCHFIPESEYDQEYYMFGSYGTSISYEFGGYSVEGFSSITKRVRGLFKHGESDVCGI